LSIDRFVIAELTFQSHSGHRRPRGLTDGLQVVVCCDYTPFRCAVLQIQVENRCVILSVLTPPSDVTRSEFRITAIISAKMPVTDWVAKEFPRKVLDVL